MVPEEQEGTDGRRQPAAPYAGPDTDRTVSTSETNAVPISRHEAIHEWGIASYIPNLDTMTK